MSATKAPTQRRIDVLPIGTKVKTNGGYTGVIGYLEYSYQAEPFVEEIEYYVDFDGEPEGSGCRIDSNDVSEVLSRPKGKSVTITIEEE